MNPEDTTISVERKKIIIRPDPQRVICQYHNLGKGEVITRVIERILALPEQEVKALWQQISDGFDHRHRRFEEILQDNYERVAAFIPEAENLTGKRKLVIGAYFSKEYSIESAALFNPSIVPHPDQYRSPDGGEDYRFILSLRATGEGHISSLEFATGTITALGEIHVDPVGKRAEIPKEVKYPAKNGEPVEVRFDVDCPISERVIFPITDDESNGIEDFRFVRFIEDDGKPIYYGTYTAYNGKAITSKLIETTDFASFRMHKLKGKTVRDKGMALFPRKINGRYAMISRQDGENLRLMYSEDILKWEKSQLLQIPGQSWEFIKLGNCGSPLETDAGWLLLMHGVGAVRQYSIGVMLLDRDDPTKIIGRLKEPLLSPTEDEREGYVPNVVYSCGGTIHNGKLIIPYAMSDFANSFALVDLDALLSELTSGRARG